MARLLHTVTVRDRVAREVDDLVREARTAGCSWSAIGSAVGMTKQGAHAHYAGQGQA